MAATLTIVRAEGGCWPGTLACDCGKEQLAIWSPEHGVACSSCHTCYQPILGVLTFREGPVSLARGVPQVTLMGYDIKRWTRDEDG